MTGMSCWLLASHASGLGLAGDALLNVFAAGHVNATPASDWLQAAAVGLGGTLTLTRLSLTG